MSFGDEICNLISLEDMLKGDCLGEDVLGYEMCIDFDVFGPLLKDWIVGNLDGIDVVKERSGRLNMNIKSVHSANKCWTLYPELRPKSKERRKKALATQNTKKTSRSEHF